MFNNGRLSPVKTLPKLPPPGFQLPQEDKSPVRTLPQVPGFQQLPPIPPPAPTKPSQARNVPPQPQPVGPPAPTFQQVVQVMPEEDRKSKLFQTLLNQKQDKERKLKAILSETREKTKVMPPPTPLPTFPGPAITFEEVVPTPIVKQQSDEEDIKKMNLFQSLLEEKKEKERQLKAILGQTQSKFPERQSIGGFQQKDKVLNEAKLAVDRRKSLGQSRSSPEVWAAVRILTDFLETSSVDRPVPPHITTAIIQLTEFLNDDFTNQVNLYPPPSAPSRPSSQQSLKQQLIAQNREKKKKISKILSLESAVSDFMMKTPSPTTAPSFIPRQITPVGDTSFMFDTIPVII